MGSRRTLAEVVSAFVNDESKFAQPKNENKIKNIIKIFNLTLKSSEITMFIQSE